MNELEFTSFLRRISAKAHEMEKRKERDQSLMIIVREKLRLAIEDDNPRDIESARLEYLATMEASVDAYIKVGREITALKKEAKDASLKG